MVPCSKLLMPQYFIILRKDFLSEIRTRQSLSAVLLFVFNAVFLCVLALAGVRVSPEVFSALFWLTLLFGASVGAAKSFVAEEDKGTATYLRFVASASGVFVGKLFYNISLVAVIALFGSLLFLVVFALTNVANVELFALTAITGAVSVATVLTLCAAMISRASAKNALLPVVAFPILLPVIFLGVDATTMSSSGTPAPYILSNIAVMFAYTVLLVLLALVVFPFVWRD
ncbi:MAG: heme exporter protein CcmB [Candidatus Kapaibacterium sp.]|jgi:heme exporter protein B